MNSKKGKQKGENKLSELSASDYFFDSLMVYSETDFLDSIGLDFNMVKDAAKMMEILRLLSIKNTRFSPLKLPTVEEINSK